jgi:HPt (histidine-containing phosphotransfer) domain-containing protein
VIPEPNSINLPGAESESQPRWVPPETLQQLAQDGDDETLAAVIAVFKSDTTSRLGLLQSAIASADSAQIRAQAHAINGSAGLVGADAMISACRKMEIEAANGSAAELSTLLDLIRTSFDEICRAIDMERGPGM